MSGADLQLEARRVVTELSRRGLRLVLAESCTGGLIAATLSQFPGVSEYLCGSAVVYRTATKTAWLGVSSELLTDPARGPVSGDAAAAIARAALARTPEAALALGITGHLGPNAPAELDGVVFVAIVRRRPEVAGHHACDVERRTRLDSRQGDPKSVRTERQHAAAVFALCLLSEYLCSPAAND